MIKASITGTSLTMRQVWMDVTDMVEYNMETINRHNLKHSFFQMSRDDPTQGFEFDGTSFAGHTYPKDLESTYSAHDTVDGLTLRLRLGSHLALFMRHQLEQHKGYTSTVGIGTNKLLAKLVGNMNKPKGQTTLMPSIGDAEAQLSNVSTFMDSHEIGKVPGIGFKLAQKLREFILQRQAVFDFENYGGTKERVTVSDVRNHQEVDFEKLEKLLGGPGSPHGIGYKVWCLLHGVDDMEVSQHRQVPRQISIEDSYLRLDTMPELLKEFNALARSLITRMRIDLLVDEDDFEESKDDPVSDGTNQVDSSLAGKKWLAHPKTLRLTTRPRTPLRQDGTRERTMKRISHSCPLPNFIFSLQENSDALAEKLVGSVLIGMFRKLHPEKAWWNMSLVNVAVTNMAEAAGESKTAKGRDIGNMFKRQDDVLRDFRVTEADDIEPPDALDRSTNGLESGLDVGLITTSKNDDDDENGWDDGEDSLNIAMDFCDICRSSVPAFAMVAHKRFHSPPIP